VNSSFQAATGGTTGGGAIRQALDAGTKALESLDPSASVDGLKKLFAGGIPTGKQLQAALDNFADITESLSPEQRKSVEKALSTQMQGRSMSDQFRQQLEKLVGEAASRR
jgi:ABC-type transporter Mla subunit MlaD